MHESKVRRIAAGVALAIGSLSVSVAQSIPAADQKHELRAPESAPKEPQGRNGSGGIKVHGHWTIEVRNQDGIRATRREFDNSLFLAGADILPYLLGGFATPGAWGISLGSSSSSGPCSAGAPISFFPEAFNIVSSGNCYITEPSGLYIATCFKDASCSNTLALALIQTPGVAAPRRACSLLARPLPPMPEPSTR